jgi:hypothetical protein
MPIFSGPATPTSLGYIQLSGDFDPSSTATTPRIASLVPAGNLVTVGAGVVLSFGTNPSTTGLINFPNNVTVLAARNAANTANLSLVLINSSNQITFGNTTSGITIQGGSNMGIATSAGNITLSPGSGGNVQVSGAASLSLGTPSVFFPNNTASPTISQSAQLSDVATNNLTITPQAPFASAVTNLVGGNVIFAMPAPVSGANTSKLIVNQGGVNVFQLSGLSGSALLYLGQTTPGASNFTMSSSGAVVTVNSSNQLTLSSNATFFMIGNTTATQIGFAGVTKMEMRADGIQLGSGTPNRGGGVKVVGVDNATTIPTSIPSTGIVIYSNGQAFEQMGSGYNFNPLVQSPTITHATALTDVATTDITITPQAPFASAATNVLGGNLNINLSVPVSGTAESLVRVKRGSAMIFGVGGVPGAGSTFSSLYLFPAASNFTPAAGNAVMEVSSAVLYLGPPTAGVINLRAASLGTAGMLSVTGAGVMLCNEVTGFGGGSAVVGMRNCTVIPTSNPASGVVFYSELTTGHFKNRGSLGAVTTMAPAGSALTINSQKQIVDVQVGTCETVSSATPTTILNYTTTTTTGGFIYLTVVSRATTIGSGIVVGDTSTAVYVLAYKNIAGTVTLGNSGTLTLVSGTNITTATALAAPVLTASVATNVITVQVANVALCTIDSQVVAEIKAA